MVGPCVHALEDLRETLQMDWNAGGKVPAQAEISGSQKVTTTTKGIKALWAGFLVTLYEEAVVTVKENVFPKDTYLSGIVEMQIMTRRAKREERANVRVPSGFKELIRIAGKDARKMGTALGINNVEGTGIVGSPHVRDVGEPL